MRVLFISGELIAGDLAYRLKLEGCDVKLYIEDKSRKDCFENMVVKTNDWRKELDWVGKDGLIVFDDVGYGETQDLLRRDGYNVFGGCELGDKIERDRVFGQMILKKCGMRAIETVDFNDIKSAIEYLKKHREAWVVKQNAHISALSHVGIMQDGSDVLSLLETYDKQLPEGVAISLQKKVKGIEIGVGRYFNGNDWVGPIELNVEYKHLFDGNVGPMTGEMGTVMWYDADEKNKIFQNTLAKMKPYLKEINFRGDIDINCIINKNQISPLEFTARLGCPSTQLQMEFHVSPWKNLLLAIAQGKNYNLKYRKGFGVILSVAIPPFPYKSISNEYYLKNTKIFFNNKFTERDWKHIHFEEVAKCQGGGNGQYCVAGSNGYIIYVSGFGGSIDEARKRAYQLVDKIVLPKMFYRSDIGEQPMHKNYELLKQWGWL